MPDNIIRTTASKTVYSNRWMRVREDDVTFPNGDSGIFGVVEKPDFVAIVPIDHQQRIHLVRQFRYPVADRLCEIPMGSWEAKPDEDPKVVAHAELQEETGLCAGRMIPIGHLFQAPGYSVQGFHLFVALDLKPGETNREATESDMQTKAFGLHDIKRLIATGEVKDATTIAAFGHLYMTGALEQYT